MMAKIAVAEDQALSKAYPKKSGCSIAVTLADGTTLQAARDYPKGDPADPLTDAEIEDKWLIACGRIANGVELIGLGARASRIGSETIYNLC